MWIYCTAHIYIYTYIWKRKSILKSDKRFTEKKTDVVMLAVGLNQHIKKGTNCIRAVLFKWWDELQYTDVSFVAMVIIMITYSDNRQYDWLTIGDLVLDSTGPFICFSIRVFTTIRCVPRHILKKSGLQTLRWNWFVWCFLIYEILRFTLSS